MTYEALGRLVNRQAELLKHVREVILPFNAKHYFIDQEAALAAGEDSLWSELCGLRRLRDDHEKTIAAQQDEIRSGRRRVEKLEEQLKCLTK